MIAFNSDSLLTLAEAAAQLPGRPHCATLQRWRQRGCRGVLLETVLIGGRRYTSHDALQRFVDGVSAAGTRPVKASLIASFDSAPAKRADAELARDGI